MYICDLMGQDYMSPDVKELDTVTFRPNFLQLDWCEERGRRR